MDLLQNFADKDMIEQITILDDIQSNGQHDAVPALFDIYATPLADVAVDEMVYHAVISLLKGRDDLILAGLDHASSRVRLLCIKATGENNVLAALPRLAELLQNNDQETELLTETVRALSHMDDPAILDMLLPGIDVPGLGPQALAGYWHFGFHGVRDLPELLVAGREREYIGWFFTQFAYNPRAIADADVDEYARCLRQPGALRAGFEYYRAVAQASEARSQAPTSAAGLPWWRKARTSPITSVKKKSSFPNLKNAAYMARLW